jgi:hypothetical protein
VPLAFDDLPDHAGAVGLRLPDGSLSTAAVESADATAYRATCSCGWAGASDHPPTDTGRMTATSEWVAHMKPFWAAAPPGWLLNRSDVLRDGLAELANTWPLQALGVLAEVERWHRSLIEQAVAAARGAGSSWADIGAALGITKQSAHERFSTTTRNKRSDRPVTP